MITSLFERVVWMLRRYSSLLAIDAEAAERAVPPEVGSCIVALS